jgi:hypothetical protein
MADWSEAGAVTVAFGDRGTRKLDPSHAEQSA